MIQRVPLSSESFNIAQKLKFSIEVSQFPADLVTFTEEILNGKFNFLCSTGEK